MGVSWVYRSPELEPSVKNIVHLIIDHPQLSHLGFITSNTAQGGGGSFTYRKPIGELGCCESGMAERIH